MISRGGRLTDGAPPPGVPGTDLRQEKVLLRFTGGWARPTYPHRNPARGAASPLQVDLDVPEPDVTRRVTGWRGAGPAWTLGCLSSPWLPAVVDCGRNSSAWRPRPSAPEVWTGTASLPSSQPLLGRQAQVPCPCPRLATPLGPRAPVGSGLPLPPPRHGHRAFRNPAYCQHTHSLPRGDLPLQLGDVRRSPLPARFPNIQAQSPGPSTIWAQTFVPSVSALCPTESLQAPFCHQPPARRQSDCVFSRLSTCFQPLGLQPGAALPPRGGLPPFPPTNSFFSDPNHNNAAAAADVDAVGCLDSRHRLRSQKTAWAGLWLYHLGLTASVSLGLSFLVCEMRTMTTPSSLGDLKAEKTCPETRSGPGAR